MPLELRDEIRKFAYELVHDLNLQARDASAQGDRAGAAIIQRVSNAVSKVFERRADAEAAAESEEG